MWGRGVQDLYFLRIFCPEPPFFPPPTLRVRCFLWSIVSLRKAPCGMGASSGVLCSSIARRKKPQVQFQSGFPFSPTPTYVNNLRPSQVHASSKHQIPLIKAVEFDASSQRKATSVRVLLLISFESAGRLMHMKETSQLLHRL